MALKYYPDFGLYLKVCRVKSRAGVQQRIAETLGNQGIRLCQSHLANYESGLVRNPDPAVLRALAELYGVPYEEMIDEFLKETRKIYLKTV